MKKYVISLAALVLTFLSYSDAQALALRNIQTTIAEKPSQDISLINQGTQTITDTSNNYTYSDNDLKDSTGSSATIADWGNNLSIRDFAGNINLISGSSSATVSSCPSGATLSADGCCCVYN